MLKELRLAASATFQFLIGTASWIGLARLLATFGSSVLAGYTIAIRLVIFAILPAWGLSNAAATMVGQGLGAKKPERAEQAVWTACRYNFFFLGGLGLIFVLAAPAITGIFGHDASTDLLCGASPLRILAAGFPLYAFGMPTCNRSTGPAIRGRRLGSTSSSSGAGRFHWPGRSLSRSVLGSTGVFIAIAVAFSTLAGASALVFRRGAWKTQQV